MITNKLHIDADILLFRAGFAVEHTEYTLEYKGTHVFEGKRVLNKYLKENVPEDAEYEVTSKFSIEPKSHAYHIANTMIQDMIEATGEQPLLYFSGDNNFRKEKYPEYKANRKEEHRPQYEKDIKSFLKHNYSYVEEDTYEADDMLGITQTSDSIIATLDKDLDMIPGLHYNFANHNLYHIGAEEADYFFFLQLLMGDRVDNIIALDGVGPKTAIKLLEPYASSVDEMYVRAAELYKDEFLGDWITKLNSNAEMLWIKRSGTTTWYEDLELDILL